MDISAIVVSCNEGALLEHCLPSISFCSEIIVVDMESTDNTREIAEKYGVRYIRRPRLPIVEMALEWAQHLATHEWILHIDPDEECSRELAEELQALLPVLPARYGCIMVPWRFYFGKQPLRGTQWGGPQTRTFLVNKNRFYFSGEVHRGRNLREGYEYYFLQPKGDNVVHHYWMQGYAQLVVKHCRYLSQEGKATYNSGERVTIGGILSCPFRSFKDSFFDKEGRRDGWAGFMLSLFWAWYNTSTMIVTYSYAMSQKKKRASGDASEL